MARTSDTLSQALIELEAEGLVEGHASSRFVEAIMKTMSDSPQQKEKAFKVSSGLERLLARHHDDSRRIISASVALGEASEYEVPQFVKKISRFMRFLDTPVASYSLKNIKLADFVSRNPELIRAKNVEAISALVKLPEGSLAMGSKKDEIWIGDMAISLERDDLKKVNQAVKQARALTKPPVLLEKVSDEASSEEGKDQDLPREIEGAEAALDMAWDEDESPKENAPARENDLPEEISQAEKALSKVLGKLASEGNSELSQVLKEARKLLLLALEQGVAGSEEARSYEW